MCLYDCIFPFSLPLMYLRLDRGEKPACLDLRSCRDSTADPIKSPDLIGVTPLHPRIRLRSSFSFSQIEVLESTFALKPYMTTEESERLANLFKLPIECIVGWFSNRRDLKRKREERRRGRESYIKNSLKVANCKYC